MKIMPEKVRSHQTLWKHDSHPVGQPCRCILHLGLCGYVLEHMLGLGFLFNIRVSLKNAMHLGINIFFIHYLQIFQDISFYSKHIPK